MSIGERLRAERKRLELTQGGLGAAVGASERAAQDWERNISAPNANYLTHMASIGVDVTFLLTGWPVSKDALERYQKAAKITLEASGDAERKARLEQLFVESAANGAESTVLSAEEQSIIENYRHASKEGRRAIEAASAAMVKPVKKG